MAPITPIAATISTLLAAFNTGDSFFFPPAVRPSGSTTIFRGAPVANRAAAQKVSRNTLLSTMQMQQNDDGTRETEHAKLVKLVNRLYELNDDGTHEHDVEQDSYEMPGWIRELTKEKMIEIVWKMYSKEHEPTELKPRADWDYEGETNSYDEGSNIAIYGRTIFDLEEKYQKLKPEDKEALRKQYNEWQFAHFMLGENYVEIGVENSKSLSTAMTFARALRRAIYKYLNEYEK